MKGIAPSTSSFSLVTAEMLRGNTLVLVGRDNHTLERVNLAVRYPAYFYVSEKGMNDEVRGFLRYFGAVKEEQAERTGLEGEKLIKVTLREPIREKELAHFLRKMGYSLKLFDLDLATEERLPFRYLLDKGIRSGWRIQDSKVVPEEGTAPLRTWYFDIEALSSMLGSVNPYREEPVIMISFYDSYLNRIFTIHSHPGGFRPMFSNHTVIQAKDERELLEASVEHLDRLNPDILAAHNLMRYDLVKWVKRLEAYGLKNHLSPKPFRHVDLKNRHVKGRLLCDTLTALKQFTGSEFPSYSLEYLASYLNLSVRKLRFPAPINELWEDRANVPEDLLREVKEQVGEEARPSHLVYVRNVWDVLAVKEYDERFQLTQFYITLARELGGLFEDMFLHHRIVETGLRRLISGRKALRYRMHSVSRAPFKGAFVYEPKQGIYVDVAMFDFKRAYPSIMVAFNISPETLLSREEPGCFNIENRWFFRKTPEGVMKEWLRWCFSKRDEYEGKAAASEEERRSYLMKANLMKIAANASYGYMSYPSSSLFDVKCSAATARILYIMINHLIEAAGKAGLKVIYGDTDSLFVQLEGRDIEELRGFFQDELNRFTLEQWGIPCPVSLEAKAIFSKLIILSKKRYAGKYRWRRDGLTGQYEFKGVELVRSDSSELERRMLRDVLTCILEGREDEAPRIVEEALRNLRKSSPFEVGYPCTLRKKVEKRNIQGRELWVPAGYRGTVPAHVRAVIYSCENMGAFFQPGDKPKRLPVKPEALNPPTIRIWCGGEERELKVKDIAVDEMMVLPGNLHQVIDWERIARRLRSKASFISLLEGKPQRKLESYLN